MKTLSATHVSGVKRRLARFKASEAARRRFRPGVINGCVSALQPDAKVTIGIDAAAADATRKQPSQLR